MEKVFFLQVLTVVYEADAIRSLLGVLGCSVTVLKSTASSIRLNRINVQFYF